MAQNNTKPEATDPHAFIAAIPDAARRADAAALAAMMERATGEPPVMWGKSIVGFGLHRYAYASGRKGETVRIGFAPRAGQTVLYGLGRFVREEGRLAALGKHTTGKGCLYIKRLAGVNLGVLEALCAAAYAAPPEPPADG